MSSKDIETYLKIIVSQKDHIAKLDKLWLASERQLADVQVENDRLRVGVQEQRVQRLSKYVDELEARIHDACEVYAGMEGFMPEHAETAYVLHVINEMYKELQDE